MDWARMLAYITGTVGQELLLRNEYLVAENRILKAQLKTPLRLTDAERATLAEIAHRLGRKALKEVANVMKPDTIMGWYRKLVARKFDGSKSRRYPGRPRIDGEIEELVEHMAKENSDWGYNRIVGAIANLGYTLSEQTVGNILLRQGIPPAPKRKRETTWADFHLESRKVEIAGVTQHPNEVWMKQIARNVTMDECGFPCNCSYLIHDRDIRYCQSFREIIEFADVKPLRLPACSPTRMRFRNAGVGC